MSPTPVHQLTVTTRADFTGAAVLDVSMTWTNADGNDRKRIDRRQCRGLRAGSPIFAWSGNDVLTGSTGNDLFV
ncbi:hypothetical protein, partial [Mesorhizobium opportunistum]|uniref:hypothetical protein n=1 Tax=Mesorhizobium opportunistum TaxID=593909 RepID=UPI00257554CE